MSSRPALGPSSGEHPLLAMYDDALPAVYGYLVGRCGSVVVAEDLTSETFLAAVDAVNAGDPPLSVPWLIGIARHKLVDHWRAKAREDRRLEAISGELADEELHAKDMWDEQLDALRAQQTLDELSPIHRAALVLRYLDDLTVPQVAAELGRTRHATEALISRSRAAFRRTYEQEGGV